MGMESVDYAAILADLEAKKAALEQAIASLRFALALGAVGQIGDPSVVATTAVPFSASGGEVPVGAFLGKSIPEAAKLCLQIVKRKLTSREIAEQLKKGGIESTAKNFNSIVHSILIRASKSGAGIMKLDRSYWGLAEWYPAAMRGGGPIPEKQKPKSKRGRRLSQKVEKPGESANGNRAGVQERIVQLLRAKPNVEVSAQDIASALDMRIQTAHFVLGKLVYKKQAEKTPTGKYRATTAA